MLFSEPAQPHSQISEKDQQKEEEIKKKEAIEKLLDEARKKYVRPWDVGKEGVKAHYEMTQEEWVDKKRSERPTEFAPPTYPEFSKRAKNITDTKVNEKSESTTKKIKQRNYNNRPKKQMTEVTRNYENSSASTPIYTSNDFENRLLNDYNKDAQKHLYDSYHKPDIHEPDSEDRGKGTEIAPPPTYEYYEPSSKKLRKSSPKHIDIEESIEAGLKFLRKQAEAKQKARK